METCLGCEMEASQESLDEHRISASPDMPWSCIECGEVSREMDRLCSGRIVVWCKECDRNHECAGCAQVRMRLSLEANQPDTANEDAAIERHRLIARTMRLADSLKIHVQLAMESSTETERIRKFLDDVERTVLAPEAAHAR